jgi:hypothetical protein
MKFQRDATDRRLLVRGSENYPILEVGRWE